MSAVWAIRCDRCGRTSTDTEPPVPSSRSIEELRIRLSKAGWSRRTRLKTYGKRVTKNQTDDLCGGCTAREARRG